VNEPLSPDAAMALIRTIIREGLVACSQHAADEMRADDLTLVDCINVLRAGAILQAPDYIRQTWRYRVSTRRIEVVVAFRSEQELAIITVWRVKR
jgi:hypothetical protein